MFPFRTLFWKIFVATFATSSCVLFAAYGFLRMEFRSQFEQIRQSEQFQQLTDYVISRHEEGFDTSDQRGLRSDRRRFPPIRIMDSVTREYILGAPRGGGSDNQGNASPNTEDNEKWRGWDFVSDSGAAYRVYVDISELPQAAPPDINIYQMTTAVGIIALFSWVLTLGITRPIRRLQRHVHGFGGGNLEREMELSLLTRKDEFGDLAVEIDQMSKRIRELIDSKQRLFYDVSHELRAPLARLQVANEIARVRVEKAGDSSDLLDRFDREIESLSQLITELMDFAKNDKSTLPIEEVSVPLLVEAIVEDFRFSDEDREFNFACDLPAEDTVEMRPALLERALKNVLENAVKYSPRGSKVDVSLTQQGQKYHLAVQDLGSGIPEDQLDLVAQPFTRLHGESIEGIGLGLSIVKRAMQDLGGELILSNTIDSGLRADLNFPKKSVH